MTLENYDTGTAGRDARYPVTVVGVEVDEGDGINYIRIYQTALRVLCEVKTAWEVGVASKE